MNVRPSAVIVKDQAILTLRYKYQSTDVYALPGGNPDPGENVLQALVRELKEELGISVTTHEMIACGEVIWPEIQKECMHIIFRVRTDDFPEINPDETTALEIVWLPISDLDKRLLYPNMGLQIRASLESSESIGYAGVISQPYIR